VGNNDNTSMEKKVAGFIVAPMWNEMMQNILNKYPDEKFEEPVSTITGSTKPILRGIWQGGKNYFVDKISGKLATPRTPTSLKEERFITGVHSILYWIDKDNPGGPKPSFPEKDPQFTLWETLVLKWAEQNGYGSSTEQVVVPTEYDDVHVVEKSPKVTIIKPTKDEILDLDKQYITKINIKKTYPITHVDYFINNIFVGTAQKSPFYFSFTPNKLQVLKENNTIRAVACDSVLNKGSYSTTFKTTEEKEKEN
jgi:hypothetical protein